MMYVWRETRYSGSVDITDQIYGNTISYPFICLHITYFNWRVHFYMGLNDSLIVFVVTNQNKFDISKRSTLPKHTDITNVGLILVRGNIWAKTWGKTRSHGKYSIFTYIFFKKKHALSPLYSMRWAEHVARKGIFFRKYTRFSRKTPEMKAPFGKSKYVRYNNKMDLK